MKKTIFNDLLTRVNARNVFIREYVGPCGILSEGWNEDNSAYTMRVSYRMEGEYYDSRVVCDIALEPLRSGLGFKKKPLSDQTVSHDLVPVRRPSWMVR